MAKLCLSGAEGSEHFEAPPESPLFPTGKIRCASILGIGWDGMGMGSHIAYGLPASKSLATTAVGRSYITGFAVPEGNVSAAEAEGRGKRGTPFLRFSLRAEAQHVTDGGHAD